MRFKTILLILTTTMMMNCKGQTAVPTALQRFFLTHKEINVAEFARSLGMNATLLRNYINGFKKPSAERENAILAHIHKLGKEMMAACF